MSAAAKPDYVLDWLVCRADFQTQKASFGFSLGSVGFAADQGNVSRRRRPLVHDRAPFCSGILHDMEFRRLRGSQGRNRESRGCQAKYLHPALHLPACVGVPMMGRAASFNRNMSVVDRCRAGTFTSSLSSWGVCGLPSVVAQWSREAFVRWATSNPIPWRAP